MRNCSGIHLIPLVIPQRASVWYVRCSSRDCLQSLESLLRAVLCRAAVSSWGREGGQRGAGGVSQDLHELTGDARLAKRFDHVQVAIYMYLCSMSQSGGSFNDAMELARASRLNAILKVTVIGGHASWNITDFIQADV